MNSRLLSGVLAATLCLTFASCKKHVASTQPQTPASSTTTQAATQARSRGPETAARPAETSSSQRSGMPDAATRARIQDLLDRIQDAYFDYDKHTLRPDAETALKSDAQTLSDIVRQYPEFRLTVEGHCDERGSSEYNLALGDARAKQAKQYLAGLGLPGDQLHVLSYGKDRPICADHDEDCWQKNRRAHITQ
jgi:peptidoglycan-associated lipoprotein